jgi:hypothetical protein
MPRSGSAAAIPHSASVDSKALSLASVRPRFGTPDRAFSTLDVCVPTPEVHGGDGSSAHGTTSSGAPAPNFLKNPRHLPVGRSMRLARPCERPVCSVAQACQGTSDVQLAAAQGGAGDRPLDIGPSQHSARWRAGAQVPVRVVA